MELNFAFYMLLQWDAKKLWQEFSSHRDSIANEEVEKWFSETFADLRTVCDKMKDLSSVQQRADEKYRSFEIRVRKMVDDIFNLKLSAEEMTRLFVFQGLKCDKLRESFALDTSVSDDRRRELASYLEKLTVRQEINAVKPKYADMVSRNTKPEYARQFTQPSHSVRQPSRIPDRSQPIVGNNDRFFDNRYLRHTTPSRNQSEDRYGQNNRPQRSMKMIAKEFYNKCRGIAPPNPEVLRPGACFCCGDITHQRRECPLRNRCLICGKHDHRFKDCYLATKPNQISQRRIMCIHDDETDDPIEEKLQEIEEDNDEKNRYQPLVPISSVGLSQ